MKFRGQVQYGPQKSRGSNFWRQELSLLCLQIIHSPVVEWCKKKQKLKTGYSTAQRNLGQCTCCSADQQRLHTVTILWYCGAGISSSECLHSLWLNFNSDKNRLYCTDYLWSKLWSQTKVYHHFTFCINQVLDWTFGLRLAQPEVTSEKKASCITTETSKTTIIKADRPLMRNTLNAPWLLTNRRFHWTGNGHSQLPLAELGKPSPNIDLLRTTGSNGRAIFHCLTLTFDLWLDLQSQASQSQDGPLCQNQGQRSNGSNRRAPTDKRMDTNTDAIKCIISHSTRSIIKYNMQ